MPSGIHVSVDMWHLMPFQPISGLLVTVLNHSREEAILVLDARFLFFIAKSPQSNKSRSFRCILISKPTKAPEQVLWQNTVLISLAGHSFTHLINIPFSLIQTEQIQTYVNKAEAILSERLKTFLFTYTQWKWTEGCSKDNKTDLL